MSQRRDIIKFIVDNLKLIDGTKSSLAPYTFNTDLHLNVYRGYKSIEEINDFPSIFITAGVESRSYNTVGTSQSSLPLMLRLYTYDTEEELVNTYVNDIVQDIEHVIYNLPRSFSNLEILDITITSINTDEGLLTPYGIVELQVQVSYEVTL
jgi:hypothetical protein